MSDEQQSNVNSQEEQEDDEENSQEEDQDQDEDGDDDQDEDEDDDQQEGSGDQDQDEDGSGDDDDEQQSGQGDDDDEQQSKQQDNKKLPTFKMVNRQQPEQFKFTSLLSEISSLSCSVDNFIGTLHTSPSSGMPRRPYSNNYATQQKYYQPQLQEIKMPQPQHSRVVIMKDCDAQVDMKPQIIIQPTKTVKQDSVIQAKPYKISTQSEKFLSQLYEQNKKLKRWQVNPSHPMNSYMTSFTGSNNGFNNSSKGFYNSKDRFERKQYQKGIFNVDERNKQIDEAIMMLKRQEQNQY